PKGVMLSYRNLISGGLNAMESHDLKPEDRALCVLPLYHINGLINTMMGPLVSGSSVFMPPKFKTSEFWGWILEHRCTWF
ncbi:MAG: AMP-binding protein, partial [bacterium]